MCAVSSGQLENVQILLKAGADVNCEDENGETVLHMTKSLYWIFIFSRKYRHSQYIRSIHKGDQ